MGIFICTNTYERKLVTHTHMIYTWVQVTFNFSNHLANMRCSTMLSSAQRKWSPWNSTGRSASAYECVCVVCVCTISSCYLLFCPLHHTCSFRSLHHNSLRMYIPCLASTILKWPPVSRHNVCKCSFPLSLSLVSPLPFSLWVCFSTCACECLYVYLHVSINVWAGRFNRVFYFQSYLFFFHSHNYNNQSNVLNRYLL